jgi:branched-chain amino acid transport system permease protein
VSMLQPMEQVAEEMGKGRRSSARGLCFLLVPVAACLVAPALGNNYYNSFLFFLFINIVMAETYDIVAGYMGYINLGHGAFFGIGAYAYGVAIMATGSQIASVAFAAAVAVTLAGIVAYPLFRLRGAYFSIATFGVLKLLSVLALNLRGLTGGSAGLSIMPTDSILITYYLAFLVCVAAVALNWLIAHSSFGLALLTIREDEEVAASSGVKTMTVKWLTLMVAAMLPGLSGAVYMWQTTYIDPDSAFGAGVAFAPVIMAMLGGSGTIAGPVVGATFLTFVQEALWSHIGYLQLTMYGIVLVAVGVLMPGGLMRNRWFARLYSALGFKDHYGYQARKLSGRSIGKSIRAMEK